MVSPASIVDPQLVLEAAGHLRSQGFRVEIAPHALGSCGTFAASRADRLADLRSAFLNPEVEAILCTRGGYGCVQLLGELDKLPDCALQKWLIGFSDVTALHWWLKSRSVAGIHSSMAKALALKPTDDEANSRLLSLLRGSVPAPIAVAHHPYNRTGQATGELIGGNLAVFSALLSTRFSPFGRNFDKKADKQKPNDKDKILFIEDISEPIYKVNRLLWQLLYAGIFDSISGLVFGRFTNYNPDANYEDMYLMINDFLTLNNISLPTIFNAPIGHFEGNLPLLHGATYTLSVDSSPTLSCNDFHSPLT